MSSPASPSWSSRYTFLLAAIGAAVGLGNIWKFPFTAGVSGGAAFVAVYVLALLCFALPIVIAELFIGRRGHKSPPNAVLAVAAAADCSRNWSAVGWVGIIAALIILPLYSMVAGWSLAFIPRMFSDAFLDGQIDEVTAIFQISMFERFASATFFEVTEFFSFNVLLPVSGLLVALFAGWMLPKKMLRDEIGWGNRATYPIWHFFIRYLSPVAILAVLIFNMI
jgi:NSS family neurotransmitter:Na+ symporter